jgi:imidazolonepropionase-like amidohydrolase
MRITALGVATILLAACGAAPPPAAPSVTAAPSRTLRYVIVSVGRATGAAELDLAADGTRRSHYQFNDRGRGPDVKTTLVLDDRGAPRGARSDGHDYWKAAVDELAEVRDGQLTWRSTSERGHAPLDAGFFLPSSGPFDGLAVLARALLRAPGRRMKLLPGGEAWIDDDARIDVPQGAEVRHLRRVAVAGLGFSPSLVWLDEHDEYFGEVSPWTSTVAAGAEALVPGLIAHDQRWRDARAAKLASQLAERPPAAGLAITHARLFDSEARAVRSDVTVVVVGDRIAAVGDATTAVPAGARIIDAHGRTLLPGLWDMHVHLGDDDGVLDLASGVTTARDLGNDVDALAARVARFEAGTELGPRVLRAGLVDGPGELSAPTGVLAGDAAEARAVVARFADLGYQQLKIYSSVKPELVPVLAAAAHARGLRVSGHIPSGMKAAQAVEAGYDEIQHANFLFLEFLAGPGEDTRTPLRFSRVAEKGAGLDLGSAQVLAFLDLLAAHHTVLDPTLVAFGSMFGSDPGQLDAELVPFAGRLPAQVERGGHAGGLPATGALRATYRASHVALGRMVKLAWDRGITIVAGTDSLAGLSLSRELELYVAAGIPAADVLALATYGAARVMGKQAQAGSIAPGKQADLVLVDGDPTRDIAAVRNADVVVCRGRVYDPAKLYAAVGMRPR